jgi:hypothetical protein
VLIADVSTSSAGTVPSWSQFKFTHTILYLNECILTGMYIHSAGSIQQMSISATMYIQQSTIENIEYVKATTLLVVARISNQNQSAHIIAMAEMVVHSS